MDRLDELATFVAILEAGSLAAAARRLRRSGPAVTRALATLEARAGTRLVERTTRRLAPTEAGKQLVERARPLLADYDAALARDAEGAPLRGVLRVTAPLVFGRRHVTPVVAGFLDRHPDLSVELVLHDRNLDLIEEGLDVALRIGVLADSGLVVRRVGEVRRLLVASPDYLSRRGAPKSPAEITGHDVVLSAGRPGPPEWRFRRPGGREAVVRLTPRLTVNEIDAALLAVRAGRGLARPLSYQVAEDLASGALVRLLPAFEPAALPVHLVTPSRHMTPKVHAFLDYAASELSALRVLQPDV